MSDSSARPLLALIPCRGGSRRIPRKWAQLVDGKPLLQHTIDIANSTDVIGRVVVTTDDPAIAAYARLRGVEVVDRPAELAADDVTIAEVVTHAVQTLRWYDDVVVLQPTCPLLQPDTIHRVVNEWRQLRFDWGITVTTEPHLFWQYGKPLTRRVNSQQLGDDTLMRESGAVQLFNAQAASGLPGLRGVFHIDSEEAFDVDTYADLAAVRMAAQRRTIGFHVVASDEKGTGHLRRCLQLTEALGHHDVWWNPTGLEAWAIHEAEEYGVRWSNVLPDLAVIDCLEKGEALAARYAAHKVPTVVFEPEGPCRHADLVLDEFDNPNWTILRPEFLNLCEYNVSTKPERVLVTFGGTDPAGMNARVERVVKHACDVECDVMVPGNGRSMAEAMRNADLVITSQGRTVHEAAAVGVPCLSIAVNERESRHARLDGTVYLGLAYTLSDMQIADTVNRILSSSAMRAEMSRTSSRQVDGRGVERVVFEVERLLRGLA